METTLAPNTLAHGCIIMASGLGTRFGGNKLMAMLGEKPLIGYVLDATCSLFAQRVVVTRHEDVALYCQQHGAHAILHDLPGRNDTVRLGMKALDGCDTVTFFQADQPLISRASVAALLRASDADPQSIWRVSFEGTPGAPMLFPAWTFAQLSQLPAGKGGGFVAKKYPEQVRMVPVRDEFELFDVDTQEDLQRLTKLVDRGF